MSVCAVRTIHHTLSEQLSPALENLLWLPHEPKSYYLFALSLISPDTKELSRSIGTYAECKHCGCVYEWKESDAE